jgi:hypothetical protein
MTDDRLPTDWPDERLADAFVARAAARPTPPDLAPATFERVRGSSSRSSSRRWRYGVGAIGAAAAIVIVVATIAIGRPAVEPGQSPSTAPGLQVFSVAEAMAIRDADTTDREIAVRGYFSPAGAMRCVPSGFVANPVRLECPDTFQWLLATPEPLSGFTSVLPSGRVGFQPLLPFLDTSVLTPAATKAQMDGSLVEVVFIGHFHDRRGHPNLCGTGNDADCDGFVVDGIGSVGGGNVPSSTVISLEPYPEMPRSEPSWTPADVDRLVLTAVPNFQILSRVALPGHRIRELEPALGTGALGIIDRPVAWEVTGLDPGAGGSAPVRRTFLIVDGTAEAYESVPWEVDNVGFVPFALVPLPLASSSSPTSVTLDLVDHEGRHLSVEIIDESGLLVSAAAVPPGTPSDVPTPGNDVAVSQVAGQPNEIRLSWVGGVCDGPMRFTIRPDGRTIFQEAFPSQGDPGRICIAVGISSSLTLAFSGPVPASEVEIVKVPAQESPAPSKSPAISTFVGEPVSVSEALERRESQLDDTEIAVRGFVWSPAITCQLSLGRSTSPLWPQCPGEHSLLADRSQSKSPDPGVPEPAVPALGLLIGPETYWATRYEPADQPSVDSPEVIVLGHFDDHRAAQCPPAQVETCRRTFVVDAVLDAARPDLDLKAIEDVRPDRYIQTVATAGDVVRIATAPPRRADLVLAVFAVSGAVVAMFEPQAAEMSALMSAAAVWIVRYVDTVEEGRPVLKTMLIVDGPIDSLGRSADRPFCFPTPDGLVCEVAFSY